MKREILVAITNLALFSVKSLAFSSLPVRQYEVVTKRCSPCLYPGSRTNPVVLPRSSSKIPNSLTNGSHFNFHRYKAFDSSLELSVSRNNSENLAENNEDGDTTKLKQSSLAVRYTTASYLYLTTFLALLLSPNRIHTISLGAKVGGACGYGMAAGVCYILNGATVHDRLGSDTYKRLNVGMVLFALLGGFVFPGEASFFPTFRGALFLYALMTVSKLVGGLVAYNGWTTGVNGWSNSASEQKGFKGMMVELYRGAKETWVGFKNENKEANIYRSLFVIFFWVCLLNNVLNLHHALKSGNTAFTTSLHMSAIARLSLVSTIVYTLKDAAERNRLNGTTFIQLNLLMGIWCFAVGVAQGIFNGGFSIRKSLSMLMLGWPFLFKANRSIKEKKTT